MKNLIIIFLFVSVAMSSLAQQKDSTLNIDSVINELLDSATVETQDKSIKPSESKKNDLTPPSLSEIISISKVFWALLFSITGYFLIRFTSFLLESFAERSTNYRITIKGLLPIVKIFGWIFITFIIIAGIFQPPIATVLAVTASVGIAVGFAAQDVLKNVFGGIMILLDRPFQVGDKIEIGSFYGEVLEIGLRSTRIVTPDDSLVSVPNGELMNTAVSNANVGEANCQVVAEIFLPITIDTEQVRQVAIESAQVSKYIYLNKPITVLFFNEIKERRSYLKMRLKAYVADIRYEFAFKSDMTEIVMKALLQEKLISAEDLK